MFWYLFGIAMIVLTFWLRWRYKNRRLLALAKKLSGPPTLPVLGNALLFICQPEELVLQVYRMINNYGLVSRFWLGPNLNIIVSDPDELKALMYHPKTSVKGPLYKYMEDFTGTGLLSGSGLKWRRHRKIAIPNFGKRVVDGYAEVFNKEVELLLEKLRHVPTSQQFDIYKYIVRTTTYSVCQTLMGLTKEQTINLPHLEYVIDKSRRMYNIVFDRMTKWYLQIDPIFRITNHYHDQKEFIKHMTDLCLTIISHRLTKLKSVEDSTKTDLTKAAKNSEENPHLSVIDRFILSGELEDDDLVQETFTIFTSSQEATAKISSYLLLMMAYHPHCQEKLYQEIKYVMSDKKKRVTEEDLKQMPYLEMVFKEIVRLFPIGAIIQRSIIEEIPLRSCTLPAGCSVVIPIYHLHRNPQFWTRPEDFDPERFNPENIKQYHPNSYIPFSLGPMDCLGRYFATKLIKTICVNVLQEFQVSSTDEYKDLKLSIAVSATPLNGFNMILTPRNSSRVDKRTIST